METWKRTPLELFNLPQHFVIPLFQRPYVWEEEEQWAPLWHDIIRVVERRIGSPGTPITHFLGAVVLQSSEPVPGTISEWNVIDGQQRLTTLQLLYDAVHAVFIEKGFEMLATQLEGLTHNAQHFVSAGENPLKLRHLNRDRGPFMEVMLADPGFEYEELEHSGERIVRAHYYFKNAASLWFLEAQEDEAHTKASLLTEVLQTGLQLVSINLTHQEDSQEIFETLNARGTPLTAADLVRNFVFQRLEQEGGDSKQAYEREWPFESKFWETPISVGRQFVSRSSLFLNQWLVSKLGMEISPHSTFSSFKSYVEHSEDLTISALLPILKKQADDYEKWTIAASQSDGRLSSVEMAFYRMRASGVELLKPLVIWLMTPQKSLSESTIDNIIRAAESWVYRRQLLRLSNSALTRVIADIIRIYDAVPDAELTEGVVKHLQRLDVTTTYWPGDDELRRTLQNEPFYRRYPRARLRMYLEALEDHSRSDTGQPQVQRGSLPIEHLLPQKWKEHWPVETAEEELHRAAHVHRLGNLTLLTSSLNSKVSNGPWSNKRSSLLNHNTITLTGRVVSHTEGREWNEELITQRSSMLVESLLQIWAAPVGHEGKVLDPQAKAGSGVELKHLAEAGLISPGDVFVSTNASDKIATAKLTQDFQLECEDVIYTSPSGAAKHYRKRATNGWWFWVLPDGRRLKDVRTQFLAT